MTVEATSLSVTRNDNRVVTARPAMTLLGAALFFVVVAGARAYGPNGEEQRCADPPICVNDAIPDFAAP